MSHHIRPLDAEQLGLVEAHLLDKGVVLTEESLTEVLATVSVMLLENLDADGCSLNEPEHTGVRSMVEIPDGAMVTSVIEVAAYWREDGKTRYGLRVAGDESYVHAYGLLEFAKMHLFTQHVGLDSE